MQRQAKHKTAKHAAGKVVYKKGRGAEPIGGACHPLPRTRAQRRAELVFHALTVFLVCGFLGWVYETLVVLIANGHLQARGFLFIMQPLGHYIPALRVTFLANVPLVWGLPLVQIYGFGGAFMCLAFRRMRAHPVAVFFTGFVSLTLVELGASYFCQYVLGQVYWDYSTYPFNFQGRISLYSSLAWGVLSVLAVKLIGPAITRFYNRETCRHRHFHAVVGLLCLYALVCALVKFVLDPGIVYYVTPS